MEKMLNNSLLPSQLTQLTQLLVKLQTDVQSQPLVLRYQIFANSTCLRWLKLLKADISRPHQFLENGVLYGDLFACNSPLRISDQINELLKSLDVEGGRIFSREIREIHNQESLDRIHDLKVELVRLENSPGFVFPEEFLEKLNRLNSLIHKLEFLGWEGSKGGAVVAIPNPPSRENLSEEDYRHFTLDTEFGGLYLDYATNGVPAVDCFKLGLQQLPTPQTTMTSGFNLCFWPSKKFQRTVELKTWLSQQAPHLVDNPKAALGTIKLGQLKDGDLEPSALMERLAQVTGVAEITVLESAEQAPLSENAVRTPQKSSEQQRVARAVKKINPSFLAIPEMFFSEVEVSVAIWVSETMESFLTDHFSDSIVWIYRGGYGLMAFILQARGRLKTELVRSFDTFQFMETCAEKINNTWHSQGWKFKAVTLDEEKVSFSEPLYGPSAQIVIHMACQKASYQKWFEEVPAGTAVVLLASTDQEKKSDHSFSSLAELQETFSNLRQILFSGQKEFRYGNKIINHFMIVGIKDFAKSNAQKPSEGEKMAGTP